MIRHGWRGNGRFAYEWLSMWIDWVFPGVSHTCVGSGPVPVHPTLGMRTGSASGESSNVWKWERHIWLPVVTPQRGNARRRHFPMWRMACFTWAVGRCRVRFGAGTHSQSGVRPMQRGECAPSCNESGRIVFLTACWPAGVGLRAPLARCGGFFTNSRLFPAAHKGTISASNSEPRCFQKPSSGLPSAV
jgi:hypothetical protein